MDAMARAVMNVGMPVDEPVVLRPGVMHRESDYPGNAKWYALPPEAPERAEKGDLGNSIIPGFEPRPLGVPGAPAPYVIRVEK
jgi:hypothetical protein